MELVPTPRHGQTLPAFCRRQWVKLKERPPYLPAWCICVPAQIESLSNCGGFACVRFYGQYLDFPFYIPLTNLQPGSPPPQE